MQSFNCMQEDLMFFGSVGASISHEMKNVLATINEMMGLLDDLSQASASGRRLNPERLQTIAGRMKIQIGRGDGILQGLSRFAHSADSVEDNIEIGDMILFILRLAVRRAAAHEIELDPILPKDPVSVTTNAFALEHLLWAGLEEVLRLCTPKTALAIKLQVEARGPVIRLQAQRPIGPVEKDSIGSSIVTDLAQRIGASVEANPQIGELAIQLPIDLKNPQTPISKEKAYESQSTTRG